MPEITEVQAIRAVYSHLVRIKLYKALWEKTGNPTFKRDAEELLCYTHRLNRLLVDACSVPDTLAAVEEEPWMVAIKESLAPAALG